MKNKSAFTLIELLIVIAILGTLGTIAIINFRGAQDRGEDSKRQTELKQYQVLLETYANQNSNLYLDTSGGTIEIDSQCGALDAAGCPDDPDETKHYYYQSNNGGSEYVLWSQLDIGDEYFVVCSTGVTKNMPDTWGGPSDGVCP